MSTLPSHLRPITVQIPVTWTADQALAVWQMLDELREKIWGRYSGQLRDLLAEQQSCPVLHNPNGDSSDINF